MRFTTTDGVELEYEYLPGENLIVFIHGLMEDSRIWEDYVEAFSEEHGIVLVDMRGHGQSDAADDYCLERMAEDVYELLEELEEENPILIGHSMGGMISLQYASKHQTKQLILVSTAAQNPKPKNIREQITRLETLIQEAPEHIHAIQKHGRFRPKEAKNCLEALKDFDLREQLTNNQTPALILVGTEDALTPIKFSEEIHKLLANSKLHIIQGAEHMLPVTHAQEIIELITKFL